MMVKMVLAYTKGDVADIMVSATRIMKRIKYLPNMLIDGKGEIEVDLPE